MSKKSSGKKAEKQAPEIVPDAEVPLKFAIKFTTRFSESLDQAPSCKVAFKHPLKPEIVTFDSDLLILEKGLSLTSVSDGYTYVGSVKGTRKETILSPNPYKSVQDVKLNMTLLELADEDTTVQERVEMRFPTLEQTENIPNFDAYGR